MVIKYISGAYNTYYMSILEGLNPEQLAAVRHDEGPMLVVAGAGTGKTQVITRRIARLVREGKAKPAEILALTFTDKAAREMAERLEDLIGWDAAGVHVMTYNSFGGRLLHRFGDHVGRGTKGGLLSDEQKSMLLQQRLGQLQYDYYPLHNVTFSFAEKIAEYISSLQNAGVTPQAYRAYADGLVVGVELHAAEIAEQGDLATMYEAYEALKVETETYDYADQIAATVHILEERPNVVAQLRREYRYILVDEYQDTSPIQDQLLRLLVPKGGNIFAVGDDDQAIYGFRGSDIANIQDFTDHFEVVEPVVLTRNYRSGQDILDASYRLIRHNDPERLEYKLSIDKKLVSQVGDGMIRFQPYPSAAAEQENVLGAIEHQMQSGVVLSDIAVLARGKSTLRTVAKQMRARRIPFAMSAELSIFEQPELLNLWYLLQWIDGRIEAEAMPHMLMGPIIDWKLTDWRRVAERAETTLVHFDEALSMMAAEGDVIAGQLWRSLQNWREQLSSATVRELAAKVVMEASPGRETSLLQRLQEEAVEPQRTSRVVRVLDDIKRLFGHMDDYATAAMLSSGDVTLVGYLRTFPKPPVLKVEEAMGEADGVQLLTVHAAKGLEFDTVYIINATQASWSEQGERGLSVPEALDMRTSLDPVAEQRRLMYVAVTRAKRELVLSAAVAGKGGRKQAVSGLLGELFEDYSTEVVVPAAGDSLQTAVAELQSYYPLQQDKPERLYYEREDGWVQISVSDLEKYAKSPHDFFLYRVLRLPQADSPHKSFGIAIHGAIQAYYEAALADEVPPAEAILARLDELWSDHGYADRAAAEAAHETARRTIHTFMAREKASTSRIVAVEAPILFELPEYKLRLTGRMDALLEGPEGLEVRDYKTGVRRDEDKLRDEAKINIQLRTYALALRELQGREVGTVTLDYIVSGTVGSVSLTKRVLDNHRDKLGELADRLRAHDFDPGPASDYSAASIHRYVATGEEN